MTQDPGLEPRMAARKWLGHGGVRAGSGLLIVALAIGAFALVRLEGGSPSPLNHLGYAPVVLAAYLFGWRGGLIAAAFVALLLGPLAVLLSLPGPVEGPDAWVIRAVFFLGVGTLTGALFDRIRRIATIATAHERELQAIVDSTTDALLVAGDDRRYIAANPAACQMLGLPLRELLGRRIDDFMPGADARAMDAAWEEFMVKATQRGEIALRRPDGQEIVVDYAATARYLPGRHLSILRDVTARKQTEAQLERLALYDPLTKLPNATLQHDRLRLAVRQARQTGTEVGLVYVGLDGFKALNEALGRAAGDRVLQVVTDRLMAATREGDSVARLGGDEFAVILGDPIDAQMAWQAAGRILLAIGLPVTIPEAGDRAITLSASGGLAMFPADADEEIALLRAADLALHSAKRSGSGLAVYTNEQDELARSRWARLVELRHALAGDQLTLHYQPVFRTSDLTVIGAEALVRWEHPTAGLLAPDEFIPLAEGAGLIGELAQVVIRGAVLQASRWASQGSPLQTAVNLSPLNLHDASVLDRARAVLDESGLDPALLKIEITESAIMRADQAAMDALAALRGVGVRVAIDDFGTGYSSLASLRSLPIDEIKLDRSFIADMATRPADRQIVGSIITLAHNLGLEVIAEGVEDRATLELLRELRCDAVQGFLTGRPVPASDLQRVATIAG